MSEALFAAGRTSVAMHLRRGVVNRGDKWRYTGMGYYAKILGVILDVRPDADVRTSKTKTAGIFANLSTTAD